MKRVPVSATASSGANPKNSCDGFSSTTWSPTSLPGWVEYDLGASYDLSNSGISLLVDYYGNTGLTIFAGNSPAPSTIIFDSTLFLQSGVEINLASTAINARYVRIQCNSNTAPSFILKEVGIYDIVQDLYKVQMIVGRDTTIKEQIWPKF